MELTSLSLTNFRSYRTLKLTLGRGLTVLAGENAQGKSNLLEAIYLLAIGKSQRAAVERELVSWEAAEAGGYGIVAASVQRADDSVELRLGLDCGGGRANGVVKRIRVNGVPKRASDLVGVLSAVLFSAVDIDLAYGPPQGRRRYLDVLLSQTSRRYVHGLQRYLRVLGQRNAVLRSMREGRAGEDELVVWDPPLCEEGAAVLATRHEAMQRLAPLAAEAFERLAGTGSALSVDYVATVEPIEAGAAPTPEAVAAALERSRRQERAVGMTVVGPHRDDIRLALDGVDLAKHASRGQARLAALALRLAEAQLLHERRGDPPVILLDDILSELDERRRGLVLEEALRYPQVLLTTAELALVPSAGLAEARVLRVADGQVLEEVPA
ncbi:MAG: DNA replication/repair protein RecF [Chloroflexi bacterium]|nr:DNA replication/repair protein RecF [Chloroflexota bacterium]